MGDGAGQDSPIHRVVAKKAGEFIKHRLSYTFSPAFPRSVQLDQITSLHESSHTIPSQAQSCFIGISIKSPPSCPHSFHNPYPSPPPTHLPHPSPTPPTPILIRKLLRHFLPTQHQPYSPKPPPPPLSQYLSPNNKKSKNIPSSLLKHATRAIGHFLVHAALLLRIDLALAEFFLDGVEACHGC